MFYITSDQNGTSRTFEKLISQLDIVVKTMKIMDQRIQTVEGQVEELYGMRNMQSGLYNNDMENNEQKFNTYQI